MSAVSLFPRPFPLAVEQGVSSQVVFRQSDIMNRKRAFLSDSDIANIISSAVINRVYHNHIAGCAVLDLAAKAFDQYSRDDQDVASLVEAAKFYVELLSYQELPIRATSRLAERLISWKPTVAEAGLLAANAKLEDYQAAIGKGHDGAALREGIKKIIFSEVLDKSDLTILSDMMENYRVQKAAEATLVAWGKKDVGIALRRPN